ncbi:MAG: FAD-binding oxidoreductase, partial [Magnetovibrio sp.]|nr:FAD-binding oxidoreductase [Magnetovibrio sp.]
ASGPWINNLLAPHDSGVPMAPVCSHYWITANHEAYPANCPVTILPDANAYARPEVGSLLFGLRDKESKWANPKDLPDNLQGFAFDEDHDGWAALEEAVEPFMERCPSLAEVEIHHYISGPSGYTPDGKYALGAAPNLDGAFVVSGCCGAGVSISGGAGSAIAQLVMGHEPQIDLSAFAPNRFGAFDPFDEDFLASCARSRSQKKAG